MVIYAGAHGLSNDLGVLLEAAEILKSEKKIRFVLIGDGKEKPELITAGSSNGSEQCDLPPSPGQTGYASRCSGLLMPAWPS